MEEKCLLFIRPSMMECRDMLFADLCANCPVIIGGSKTLL